MAEIVFCYFSMKTCSDLSSEPTQRDGSNEGSQRLWENKEIYR